MNKSLAKEFGPRLTRLHNGAYGLRQGLQVRTSVPNDAGDEPVVDFVSSDESVDRYNEIISASGWDLVSYLKNPVFQDSHDYASITRTIGKAAITEVRGNKLFQRIVFAVDANPLAKIAYALYKGGFLNAVSVGFVPVKWQNGGSTTGYSRKYTKQILLETSAVAIPANPNALQLGYDEGAVEKSDLKDLLQMLREVTKPISAARSSNTSALGTTRDEAQQTPRHDMSAVINLMQQTAALCRK
jgi:uncharacterized protein